jgi:hypothetical protein
MLEEEDEEEVDDEDEEVEEEVALLLLIYLPVSLASLSKSSPRNPFILDPSTFPF